jgi:hypothetical protein
MTVAAVIVPVPNGFPVVRRKVLFLPIGPRDEMPAVVRRQVNAVGLVVGGDDDAADVEDAVLA